MVEITGIYNFLPLSKLLLTSGQPTKEQFPAVAAAGVKAVINLAPATSQSAVAEEESIVRGLGMEYFHIPIIWDKPSPQALEKFMDVMGKMEGQKVLIHCAANMRVSTFVALYRILRLGWDHDRAFKDVYRLWNPYEDEHWQAFINKVLKTKK